MKGKSRSIGRYAKRNPAGRSAKQVQARRELMARGKSGRDPVARALCERFGYPI